MRAVGDILRGPLIANARMYSSGAPAARVAWTSLLNWVAGRAGGAIEVLDYPPPKPLDELWARADLGATFMCGLPWARDARRPTPIVAPVVRGARYGGAPVYFTDVIVRADSPYQTLEDTFGSRLGYTVHHSQSGYVALREHLLPYREKLGSSPYREIVGPLYGARDIVDAVIAGRIDVGPLDSYVHDLIDNLQPETGKQLRVVATTRASPIPLFVATAPIDPEQVRNLQDAFRAAIETDEMKAERDMLLLADFVVPQREPYEALRRRADAAERYPDTW
ncbi:MAG: PhnD/SsuA/transferrin family substrate-binding protein [Alphaproteobacteria bacterium]|nr:PhnD/SsuA/transferrin family substrate-binding protein [Alphaproteobacteria bacterium]